MNIINTGPTPHGWHMYENILRCAQLYAWGEAGSWGGVEMGTAVLEGQPRVPDRRSYAPADLAAAGRPAPSAPLIRGTLLHVFMAHWYETRRRAAGSGKWLAWAGTSSCKGTAADVPEPLASAPDALEHQIVEYELAWPSCTDDFRSKLRAACNYYTDVSRDDDERFEVLAVEAEFADEVADTTAENAQLAAGLGIGVPRDFATPFTQRVDLIVRERATGLIFYDDHKSTARIDAKVRKRYTLSGQFLALQHFGNLRHGKDFGGVRANLVGLNPAAWERMPIERAPFRLARFPRDVVHAARLARSLRETYGSDPAEWPGSPSEMTCFHAYGPCEYREVCRFGPEASVVDVAAEREANAMLVELGIAGEPYVQPGASSATPSALAALDIEL